MNIKLLQLIHNYGLVTFDGPKAVITPETDMQVRFTQLGGQPDTVQLSLLTNAADYEWTTDRAVWDLEQLDEDSLTTRLLLMNPNDLIGTLPLTMQLDYGDYTTSEEVQIHYFLDEPVVLEDFDQLDRWTVVSGNWGLTDTDAYSTGHSLTESPIGNSSSDTEAIIELNDTFQRQSGYAWMTFWTRYDIESGYDYGQVQISVNDGTWQSVCGELSKRGSQNQDEDEPIYDGQQGWQQELIDLSAYLNERDQFRLRLKMTTDGYVEGDGWYVDELRVYLERVPSMTRDWQLLDLKLSPNPTAAGNPIRVDPPERATRISLWDVYGRRVREQWVQPGQKSIWLSTEGLQAGTYLCRWQGADGQDRGSQLILTP